MGLLMSGTKGTREKGVVGEAITGFMARGIKRFFGRAAHLVQGNDCLRWRKCGGFE